MDLNLLQAELAKPEYAGLSDAGAAEAINAKTATGKNPGFSAGVQSTLESVGAATVAAVWAKVKAAAEIDPAVTEILRKLQDVTANGQLTDVLSVLDVLGEVAKLDRADVEILKGRAAEIKALFDNPLTAYEIHRVRTGTAEGIV